MEKYNFILNKISEDNKVTEIIANKNGEFKTRHYNLNYHEARLIAKEFKDEIYWDEESRNFVFIFDNDNLEDAPVGETLDYYKKQGYDLAQLFFRELDD